VTRSGWPTPFTIATSHLANRSPVSGELLIDGEQRRAFDVGLRDQQPVEGITAARSTSFESCVFASWMLTVTVPFFMD
jgi:hypothetical protein